MAEFSSEVRVIPHSSNEVFSVLSDMNNLGSAINRSPEAEDKAKEVYFDEDSCSISIDPVGSVNLNIVERNPDSSIKLQADKLPFGLNLSIDLNPISDTETEMRLTIDADLNPFLKPMFSTPLQKGVEKMAEFMAELPFEEILNKDKEENA